jgi:UDP-hydrolysing UDP-N-acetyl-D-glucosamine 2-epimerase
MSPKRRIALVTGGRADFGLVRPIRAALAARAETEPLLVVAAAHLSAAHGGGADWTAAEGIVADATVDMLVAGDTPLATARSIGAGVAGVAEALVGLRPDAIVLVGDRFEILAAASAALALRLPIAHVHGGESTEGAYDEQIRHAVTKMAHLHFVAAEPFARRVVAMGEDPDRVFVSGAPGLDNLPDVPPMPRAELAAALGLAAPGPFLLATWHPVTLDRRDGIDDLDGMLAALVCRPEAAVFTAPNADDGRGSILARIEAFRVRRPDAHLHRALGTRLYFNAMRHAAAMLGNSSSGLIEAPSFGLPAVNIGPRQAGRLRAANVVDCAGDQAAIEKALARALDPAFRAGLAGAANPYGDGKAGARIAAVLASVDLGPALLVKRFHEAAA